MANDMVTRCARAMWEKNREVCGDLEVGTLPWEEETEALRDDWRLFARAALEAMREPTRAMLWAHELPHIGPDEIRECWRAMISAALSQEDRE